MMSGTDCKRCPHTFAARGARQRRAFTGRTTANIAARYWATTSCTANRMALLRPRARPPRRISSFCMSMLPCRRGHRVTRSSRSSSASCAGADAAMAVYFLNMKMFGRAGGSSAVSAVAYRAGERIRDERTGRTYDHSDRQDVMHKEIVLPSRFTYEEMAWALDRARLWNAAESAETRRNARVAREYLVALPVELSPRQRLGLVQGFSRELTDRYGFAIDFAIHAPRDFHGSDPRNFHAHLLATTREIAPEGLGAKTTLYM